MKRCIPFLFLFSLATACIGCGGPTPDPETEAKQEELNESPDYEKEMMGGGDK